MYINDVNYMYQVMKEQAEDNYKLIELAPKLHEAIYMNNFEQVKILLERGVDPDCSDENEDVPLHIACMNNNQSIVELLIKHKANINAQGALGFTTLHQACSGNSDDIVRVLLKAGANPNISADHNFTVMHMACAHNNESIVKLLLDYGANPDVHSTYVSTPLHKACEENNEVIVKLLLDHGAKVDGQENYIPLCMACANNNESIIKLLLDYGADVNAGSEVGNTPLYIACDTSSLNALLNDHDILYQIKHDNIIKILLKVGANIDDDRILNNSIIKQAKLIDNLFIKQEHLEQNTFFDVSMLDMLIFRFNHILKVKIKTGEINNDKMYLLQHNLKDIFQDSENILDKLFESSPLKIIYTNLDNFMESSALPLKHSVAQKISYDISQNIPIDFSILPVDMIDLIKVWQSNFTL